MRYSYCKDCCFCKNGKCSQSGPTVDLISYAKKSKAKKKTCKKFKLRIKKGC